MSDFIHYDYTFKNPALLQNALTHSSYANENREKGIRNNERLEFLGDSVLGLICARYIYSEFRSLPEGELTKLRAAIVCENSLYEFALQIDLGERLLLGRGERVAAAASVLPSWPTRWRPFWPPFIWTAEWRPPRALFWTSSSARPRKW